MDQARFVRFSSSHNLDQVPAGDTFTATWRMRNTGSTTWTQDYRVVHIHANQGSTLMTDQANYALTAVANKEIVPPGEEVEITLEMTAPAPRSRRYFTDWRLQNPDGRLFGQIMWLRVVTVKPPRPEPPAGFLRSDSEFVADHTVPDGTSFEEGESFLKQWVVRNTGQRKWNSAYRLVFVSGDREMAGASTFTVPEADPGDEVVLSINMVAPPAREQAYVSTWRLHDDRNIPFGHNFWVKIFSTLKEEGFGIKLYSQNDPRWQHRILGQGPQTFGEFGCLITCFSMMLSGFGEDLNPLELNQRVLQLPAGRGFSGSEIFFAAPAYAIDHVKYYGNWKPRPDTGAAFARLDTILIASIDQALARKRAVMVQVDTDPIDPYTPQSEQHWVLVLARQGNDYLVADPINGQQVSLLNKYGRQSRPQDPEEALKDAIKSALFYASTEVSDGAAEPDEGDEDGMTNIGGELKYSGPAWSFGRCLKGVHDRANRHPQPADYAVVNGRFESVKVQSGITVPELQGYRVPFFLCRLFESWNGRHVPVEQFVNTVSNDIERLVNAGVEYFEFHNEPNLTHEGWQAHGIRGSWRNGAEFAAYFRRGRKLLQRRFPGIKVGFPGLSPGPSQSYQMGHDRGFRLNHIEFLDGAVSGVEAADFVGVHAYYLNMEEVRQAAEQVKWYRRRYPDKLLFVTEFSNPAPFNQVSAREKGRQAAEFYRLCNDIPGVGAAYYFIVSGSGWDDQALRRNADGRSTGIADAIF